ncbi:MAG: HAD family hydrolase, partial [Bacteroidota bacterium]
MKVVEQQEVSPLFNLCMALNHDVKLNDKDELFGESTELALVQYVTENINYDTYRQLIIDNKRVAELPFDSTRKCMTTVHEYQGEYLIVTKGAIETIASLLLNETDRSVIMQHADRWANEGKRVLAYGYKIVPSIPEPFNEKLVEKDLLPAGIVGLMDPPREEVKAAIAECNAAGIKPVMITGAHPATAKALAGDIGIMEPGEEVMTGHALQQISDEVFYEKAENIAVYARVSPEQKLRIVRMLQSKGHFVAMTGDGVNDA